MSNKVNEVQTQSVFGDAACYTQNLSELLAKIAKTLPVSSDGSAVKIEFKTVIALLQAVWDQFKKAARECAGKEVEVPATGIVWTVARTLFSLVGFRP